MHSIPNHDRNEPGTVERLFGFELMEVEEGNEPASILITVKLRNRTSQTSLLFFINAR